MTDRRVQKLQGWEEETGLTLPMAADQIIRIEDEGHIIDLTNGKILIDGVTPALHASEPLVTAFEKL